MPLPIVTLSFAVIAHDVNRTLQVRRHRVLRNVSGPCLPRRRHALLTNDSLLADWATIIEAGEFPEAVRMDGVTAGQILGRLSRREHILATNRAVVLVLVPEALVRIEHAHGDTHAALVAVPECLDATHPAEATLSTVERLLGLFGKS